MVTLRQEHQVGPLEALAKSHWKEFRPTMYRGLLAAGKLDSAAQRAAEETVAGMKRVKEQLLKKGYTDQQAEQGAWELMREEYILLPSEEDQKLLGENPTPENQGLMNLLSMRGRAPRVLKVSD